MRVIAGSAGGLKLLTRESEETRPTLDRVKEAVFSMLQPYLAGAVVLDLFAGSGALGIEALSRGASSCVFCDRNRECCSLIKRNLQHTGLSAGAEILQTDFREALGRLKKRDILFDIVLLDPPYGKGLEQEAAVLLSRYGLCAEGALLVAERSRSDLLPTELAHFVMDREKAYGTVGISIYEKKVEA